MHPAWSSQRVEGAGSGWGWSFGDNCFSVRTRGGGGTQVLNGYPLPNVGGAGAVNAKL